MDREDKVVGEFITNGKQMVTVFVNGNAHVMDIDEWKIICVRNNMDRWLNPRKCKYKKNTKSKMVV